MAKKQVIKPSNAAAAAGPYNHGVRIGDLLYCSGQIGMDPATNTLAEGIEGQTARVLENVKLILESEGLGLENVVKSTVFLTNMGDFAKMNEVYARYFVSDYPARSTVQVSALPRNAMVEIEVIAHY